MQNVIVNILIFLNIGIIFMSLGDSLLNIKKNNKIENQSKNKKDFYTIEFSKIIKIIMTIGLLFFFAIFIINVLTYFEIFILGVWIDIYTTIFFGLFVIFYLFMFQTTVFWKVIVDDNQIIHRNLFGKTRVYSFDDIISVKNSNKKLVVKFKNKKSLMITEFLPMSAYFIGSCRQKGIKIN